MSECVLVGVGHQRSDFPIRDVNQHISSDHGVHVVVVVALNDVGQVVSADTGSQEGGVFAQTNVLDFDPGMLFLELSFHLVPCISPVNLSDPNFDGYFFLLFGSSFGSSFRSCLGSGFGCSFRSSLGSSFLLCATSDHAKYHSQCQQQSD